MGGAFSFSFRGYNGKMSKVSGKIVGQSGDEDVDVEVSGSDAIPDGIYSIPSSKGENVKAILSDDALKNVKMENRQAVEDDVFVDFHDLKLSSGEREKLDVAYNENNKGLDRLNELPEPKTQEELTAWEKAAEDIVKEVEENPAVSELIKRKAPLS